MLSRLLIGLLAAGAAAIGVPGEAAADPNSAPPPAPNVNAFASVKPSEYAMMGGPVHKDASTIVANLRALTGEMKGWGLPPSIAARMGSGRGMGRGPFAPWLQQVAEN